MKFDISIIYCYRNREISRLKRSIDSLVPLIKKEIEVIFIDYGSDEFYSILVQELLKNYSFVKYFFNETRGLPWNRSHALNSGVKVSNSDFIFTADVDLIFTDTFVDAILKAKLTNNATFFSVYLTPKGFNDWQNIKRYQNFVKTTNQGLGISLMSKSLLIESGGYDEFFSFWGYEDNELFWRLREKGVEGKFHADSIIAYHQWHVNYYDDKTVYPSGWRDFMKDSFNYDRKSFTTANFINHGKMLSIEDRPALCVLLSRPLNIVNLEGTINYIQFKISELFRLAHEGENITCKFKESTYANFSKAKSTRVKHLLNLLLSRIKFIPFLIQSKYEGLHVSKYQMRDVFIYFVYENKNKIMDYAYEVNEVDDTFEFVLVKK